MPSARSVCATARWNMTMLRENTLFARKSRLILIAILAALTSLPATATVLTGSVRSEGAQAIMAPPSMTSPVTLSFFVADGTRVKKGQAVLRIDASSASGQLQTLEDKITLMTSR